MIINDYAAAGDVQKWQVLGLQVTGYMLQMAPLELVTCNLKPQFLPCFNACSTFSSTGALHHEYAKNKYHKTAIVTTIYLVQFSTPYEN
jgi:hypothetical protein